MLSTLRVITWVSLGAALALTGCTRARLLNLAKTTSTTKSSGPQQPHNGGSSLPSLPPATGTVVVSGGGFASSAQMQAIISIGPPGSQVVQTASGMKAHLGPQGILDIDP